MKLKLKDAIILKDVNEDCVYAMDCVSDDDNYFKFNGPAKFFIEHLKEGKQEEEILELVIKTYTDCTKDQVRADWNDFIDTIKKFKLTAD